MIEMSVTSSTFNTNGRLGNMLFRYASLLGLAEKHKTNLKLPEWKYSQYFEGEFPIGDTKGILVKESTFKYIEDWGYINWQQPIDIHGYLQSEKYFNHCKESVKKSLTFKSDFVRQVKAQFDSKNVFDKKTIAISVRRGDYVNNPYYELLPITYYILSLFENFPDWRDCNIIIFSDDIPYCKVHFDCIPNVFFSQNNSDIEDICLMSQCDNFILSNSTFSWWGAWLGEKENSVIVRPNYLFAGKGLEENDWSDFYPERWTTFDHKKENGEYKKIDLSDVCFTIPVAYDHQDRKENLDLCIAILRRNFDCEISVYEQSNDELGKFGVLKTDSYLRIKSDKFHRTKMLNEMALNTNKKFIFNWDADVFISPLQIYESVSQLRNGSDMVYPYAWAFARMPRNIWFVKIRDYEDIGMVCDTRFNGMNIGDAVSVGGAVGYKRESFLEVGGENENFISYGAEDVERKIRFEKLGYKIERSLGATMYHMNHFVGLNSSPQHEDFKNNDAELAKINSLSKEQLMDYIKTWDWNKVKSENE